MKDSLVCKGPAKTRFSPLEQINFYLLMIHNAMKGRISQRLIFGNNCLVFIFCIHQSDYSFIDSRNPRILQLILDTSRRFITNWSQKIYPVNTVKTGPSRLIFGNNCLVFIFCIHHIWSSLNISKPTL